MTSLPTILALGFVLGMRHATDPDHVIAVTTIVTRHRSVRSAALVGVAWGVGHTLTILLVGCGIILFKWAIPPRVGLAMELAVAVMLIVLGLVNLRGAIRWIARALWPPTPARAHAHSHGDYVHAHPHADEPAPHPHAEDATPLARVDRRLGVVGAYRLVRPLVVGVVHGLAGSAAVSLLVLAAIQSPRLSVVYLLIFGIGTVAGMMVITAALGVPFALSGKRFTRLHGHLNATAGLISLAFGLIVAYQIGVGDGLFSAAPHWTPR